jgi:hypothetical protein
MRGKPRRHLDTRGITRGPLDFCDSTLGVGIHAFRQVRVSVSREIESRAYNNTQKNILDVMIAQSVESSGGPDKVTIDQLIGIKEMLENEFTLAAALSYDENAEEIGGL